MIYIAAPYSSPIEGLQEQRFQKTRDFVKHLMSTGYMVYSPVVYTHRLAGELNLPGDADYWHQFNVEFLKNALQIFLLRLPGWDQSKGVRMELNIAKILGIPVIHFDTEFNLVAAPIVTTQGMN